jgi:inner membrane protein
LTLPTHVAFAAVLYLGGATLFGYRPDWIGWLLAAVASGLPDADLPTSKIGRLFGWLSVPLSGASATAPSGRVTRIFLGAAAE